MDIDKILDPVSLSILFSNLLYSYFQAYFSNITKKMFFNRYNSVLHKIKLLTLDRPHRSF